MRSNSGSAENREARRGLQPGDRVTLSKCGEIANSRRTSHKEPGERGTVVAVLTSTSIRVKWDRFKKAQTMYVRYLKPTGEQNA